MGCAVGMCVCERKSKGKREREREAGRHLGAEAPAALTLCSVCPASAFSKLPCQ